MSAEIREIRGGGIPPTMHSIIRSHSPKSRDSESFLLWRRLVEFFPFDAEYLRRLIAGEPPIVEHFVDYFSTLLTIRLRKRGVTRAVIEDVTQETFLRVFKTIRAPQGIRSPERIGAFVCRVCDNVLHEWYRDKARIEPLGDNYADTVESDDDAYLALVSAEDCARTREVLGDLTDREEGILRAVFMDERPKDDICAQWKVDRKYLRVLIHRAKNHFRSTYLGTDDDDHHDEDPHEPR